MGDYYSLRFEAHLHAEYIPVIEHLYETHKEEKASNFEPWHDLASYYPGYEFIRKFAFKDRSSFIPFGILCYEPDDWNQDKTGLFGDIWRVACSLKNQDTMQFFFKEVLSPMASKINYCQAVFEKYEIIPPKLVQVGTWNALSQNISLQEVSELGIYDPVQAYKIMWQHSCEHNDDWAEEGLAIIDEIRSFSTSIESPEIFLRICEKAFGDRNIPDTLKEMLRACFEQAED